jgi:type I restriction enzyme S subunit
MFDKNKLSMISIKDFLSISENSNHLGLYKKEDVLSVSMEFGVVNQIKLLGRTFASDNLINYKIVEPYDLIYTKSPLKAFPYGIFKMSFVKGIVSPLYAVYKPKFKEFSLVADYYYSSPYRTNKYLKSKVNKGAKNTMNISDKYAISGQILLPDFVEFKKIGLFLSAIDELINLQKNKIFLLRKKLDYYVDSLTRSTISFNNKNIVDVKTIDYYADVKSGGTPDTNNPNYWGGEIPWFTPTEIGEYKYVETSSSYLSKEGLKNSSASEIPPNSILLTSRATIGEAAINLVSCTTNQGFQNLIPKSQTDLNFLYYIIRTLKSEFKKYSNGSTFSEISKKTISKIKVPYFDYENQKRIGRFLSLIDERISKEKEKLNLYTNLKKHYLKEIFQ